MRGLKVTGKKAVLVARGFSAFENNVVVIKTAEEVEAELRQEYDDKLKLDEMNISDPFKLNNWMAWWRGRNSLLACCTNLLHYTILDDRQWGWRSESL